MVFFVGTIVNIWAYKVLVGMKRLGGGYKVLRRGLFELVTCPNYFGKNVD